MKGEKEMEEVWSEEIVIQGKHESLVEKPALHGAVGWAALLGTSVLQLFAVTAGAFGAFLRWMGRSFVRSGGDAMRAGRHLRDRVDVEWED